MSNTCNSCGSTGGLSRTCATKLSEITWDGGSTCNGLSGTNPVDIILGLAQSICNLDTEWSAFVVDSDDITYTTTSTVLTTVIDSILADVTTLQADIAALDGTLVLEYDNSVDTYDSSGTTNYGDLKTFSIPADTFNADDEYLLIEVHTQTAYTGSAYGEARLQITLDGQAILTYTLATATEKPPIFDSRIFVIPVRVSSSATNGDYHGIFTRVLNNPRPGYGTLTATTGLTFTSAMDLKIRAYNTTGVVSCDLLRVTKFRKTIIY